MQLDKNRKTAEPGKRSKCPICDGDIIAKCGSINIWHWAHESTDDCDQWYEPMSEWHLGWQGYVKEECREVIIGEHRADIRLSDGRIIELQNSSIAVEDIWEREEFYDNMIWIFNGKDFKDRFNTRIKISKYGNEYRVFKWKRARKHIVHCRKPVYIDFGDQIFEVKRFNEYENDETGEMEPKGYGWGFMHFKDRAFMNKIFYKDFNEPKTKGE